MELTLLVSGPPLYSENNKSWTASWLIFSPPFLLLNPLVVSIHQPLERESLTIVLLAVFPTDLGNELFLAAKVVGSTLGAFVEQIASTQGEHSEYTPTSIVHLLIISPLYLDL